MTAQPTPSQFDAILDLQGHEPCPGVAITPDIEIRPATPNAPRLFGFLYQPERKPPSPAPGLLMFHGGGFCSGHPAGSGALAKILALTSGATVLCPSYRVGSPEKPAFPGILADGIAAWRWFAQQAPSLGADPARLAAGGSSAGVFLATHLAVRSPLVASALAGLPSPSGLIVEWGPLDFVARWFDNGENPGAEINLFGVGYAEAPALYHRASPLTHAHGPALPPALFLYGRTDNVVHPRQGRLGLAAWRSADAHAELMVVDNVGHGVQGCNRASRRQALEKAAAFFAARVAQAAP